MCIGVPMRIVESDEMSALCEWRGERRRLSLMLTGPLPAGTFVLAHLDTAMRVLDAGEAARIDDALAGLAAALEGEDPGRFFADLVDREPLLPPHLAG